MSYRLTTKKSWDDTVKELVEVFRLWGVKAQDWRVEPIRPYKARNQYQTSDERRVKLHFTKAGRQVTLTMAQQDTAQDNLRVLYLICDSLRLNEVRGHAQVYADAARQLYPALPAPVQIDTTTSDPYAVLQVQPGAPLSVCDAAYRALAKQAHPDNGGSAAQLAQLAAAIEVIRKHYANG